MLPQPKDDAMTVDAQRIEALFQAALAAADPAQQTAILDRECGADAELRQQVEALLKEHDAPTSVIQRSLKTANESAPPSPDATAFSSPPDDRAAMAAVTSVHDQGTAGAAARADGGAVRLDFLQPAAKPGSLGRLGHNEVLEVLGRGAFGIVVRAFDEKLQRVVAIKVLSPHFAATSPARKRFLREARASACIRHENVVQIYDVEEQPLPYLVMEYIPGQTLQQRLDETGPLDPAEVLRVGQQIARGLAAAHAQGLIHRDIKPGNILLERGIEQKVKITDFGLARAADDASLTQSGVIAGTPLYMAPEQAKGDTLDPRADLFSLGSVLYAMTSGRPPFRASTPLAVLKRVAEDTPRPIREIVPEVPQWLCDLIARLHAKDPARRFQSARDVAELFGRHLAHLQQPTLVPLPDIAGADQPRRHLGTILAAVLAVVVLGAIMISGWPWRSAGPTPVDSGAPGGGAPPTELGMTAGLPLAAPTSTHMVQDGTDVSSALIDFAEADRRFGTEPYDNPVRRAAECNAFLVRFDLDKLGLPPKARVVEAKVSFYVWDPSSAGNTKVCAFALKTAWEPQTVTWRQPAFDKSWAGGATFSFAADTGSPSPGVVVKAEDGSDTAEPPIEYQLDVTDIVRAWLEGGTPNYGLAIAPVIDTSVDEGLLTRFQVCGALYSRSQFTPKLTVQSRP